MVPVYNEENTLEVVLNKVLSLNIDTYEVLIVDDASSDNSSNIIKKIVKSHDNKRVLLKAYRHPKNRGKGAGIKTALLNASGNYFVVHDADLEYDPNDIGKLLKVAYSSKLPVVYGSRFLGDIKNMPKPNYYGNQFYNKLIRALYGVKITDMHTCYKMVKTEIIKDLDMKSEGFDYATELISKLLKKGFPIHEEPIMFNGRNKKAGKKINYKDGIDCTYKIFKYKLQKNLT
jgi:glycosyltransferase involved in cell wall biosynthesis